MSSFKKIVILDKVNFPEDIAEKLSLYSENPIEVHNSDPKDSSEIIKRLRDTDCALLTWRTPIIKEIIEASPDLKFICLCATNAEAAERLSQKAIDNITAYLNGAPINRIN